MGRGSWQGANRVSGQCGAYPGYSSTYRGKWTDINFSSGRPRGTMQSRAYSVLPVLVHWHVRFSATMRPAMMYGRTCGLNAVKEAASQQGPCFH